MKIIVFSNGAWDDTTATGNTFSNFFGGDCWNNDQFYNIYMRDAMPNNRICNNYYRLTLKDMLKHFCCKEKIGYEFNNISIKKINYLKIMNEKKYIDLIHKYSLNPIYLLADYVYRRKKWINKRFSNYIKKVQPDIFYAHVNNFAFLNPLIQYVKKNSNAKIVILLTDNLYEDINNKSIFRRKKLKKDFICIMNSADKIYAITEELKDAYGSIFNKNIDILYKGCSFEYPVQNKINDTIRFVYAGNLLYGRDKVLHKIAKAIEKNNLTNKTKAFLEIYTGDTITNEFEKNLNIHNCSKIMGKKEYKEIMEIENKSDYILHVESFEKKQIEYVKYSFSTKIMDCLQSGSCLVGVGPSEIASIKYIEKVPGAHIIKELNRIDEDIFELINNKNIVDDSIKTRNYAIKKHEINQNRKKIRDEFLKL